MTTDSTHDRPPRDAEAAASPPAEPTDRALLDAWIGGRAPAFAALVRRHQNLVHATCRRLLPAVDADDATQAVFLVLARRPADARRSPALAAWLVRTARHVAATARRGATRRDRRTAPPEALMSLTAGHHPDPGDDATHRDALTHLDDLLDQLPERERAAITLHYLAGRSQPEVARELGMPVNTVYSHLKRGLERLRGKMRRRGVTLSVAALVGVLSGQASAAPAPALADALAAIARSPDAASAASPTAQDWANGTVSTMTSPLVPSLAMIAGLAIAGGLIVLAARSPATPPDDDAPAPSVPTVIAADPPAPAPVMADPGDALPEDSALVVRLNDVPRSLERFRSGPYASLAATAWAHQAGQALVQAATKKLDPGVEPAALGRDIQSLAIGVNPAPAAGDSWWVMAALTHGDRSALDGFSLPGSPVFPTVPTRDGRLLRFVGSPGGIPPLPRLRRTDGTPPSTATTSDAAAPSPAAPVRSPGVPAPRRAHAPDADLEATVGSVPALIEVLLSSQRSDPGVEEGLANTRATGAGQARLSLAMASFGIRERLVQTMSADKAMLIKDVVWPVADAAQFATLPADTLCAAVLGTSTTTNMRMLDLMEPYGGKPLDWGLIDAELARLGLPPYTALVTSIDGGALFYVQAGAPFPSLSAVIGMKRDLGVAVLALLDDKAKTTTGDDGVHSGMIGPVPVAARYDEATRHLIITTHPGGIPAVIDRQGGFADQPEVQAALREVAPGAMIKGASRSKEMWGLLGQYAAMSGKKELMTLGPDLRRAASFGFLSWTMGVNGSSVIESGGLLGGYFTMSIGAGIVVPLFMSMGTAAPSSVQAP